MSDSSERRTLPPQRITGETSGNLGGSAAPNYLYRRRRLPPELIDSVIDALHDDRTALKICALVCKSWIHASRHHLFSQLTISPFESSDLVTLLSSASCTIGPAVRDLTLTQINDLHEIACRLPHVTHLMLWKSTLSESQAFASPATVSFLQRLEGLRLPCVKFDNPNTFLSLLSHCIRLRSLDCQYLSFNASNKIHDLQPLPSDRHALTPELRALGMFDSCESRLNRMLGCWGSEIPRLTKLTVCFSTLSRPSHGVKRLLEAVSSSLEVFESWGARWMSHIEETLTRFTRLRSFCVTDRTLQFITEALSHLTSTHLQELTIGMDPTPFGPLDNDEWSKLGILIETSPNIKSLRTLTFRFWRMSRTMTPRARREMEQRIGERFPLCLALGALHFEYRSHLDGPV